MRCSQAREVVLQTRYGGSAAERKTFLTLGNFAYCTSDQKGDHLGGDLLLPSYALVDVFCLVLEALPVNEKECIFGMKRTITSGLHHHQL